jgi:hypothetical protein
MQFLLRGGSYSQTASLLFLCVNRHNGVSA